MSPTELKEITLAVCGIARDAGAYIRGERTRFSLSRVEHKHAHDYVSYVDKGSEERIVSALRRLLPDAGFITEEGSASHGSEEYVWVVDPLDGTTNFIHSYAPYAVSIALVGNGRILLGVVYEVCADECFYAWQGGGAYLAVAGCAGQTGGTTVGDEASPAALHVSRHRIEDALLCLQLPYNSDAYKPLARHFINTFYGRVASIRMNGSAAMSLCYVAAGRLDGYAERYIGPWDFMAGSLIVMEAGGTVTDYAGSNGFIGGDGVVATNGMIHQDLLDAIASCP